ncbi:putative Mn2+ efflux pump MntP [Desulfosalsimonas propionicica]|jgi:putative Mn2+ efflux pump MntP|uniref:Putative manganese efflux pump MntP n=1 Tax=Desulfosalsimonas propionicica TaxID=332175 RepID=A0A7W0C610_9BACT|nr:manganese efflux pump MntP family protein [Desulfosalsimonas propionicica]MBA2879806.1 putative Mn2+ efflux pump MntP [Desulfosalsimonas propionicica]
MNIAEIILIALSLAMDAFAVSVAAGTAGRLHPRAVFRLSFHFGLFQFMMPVLGWYAGSRVAHLVSAVDHWVAFGLLMFVGLRMIRGSLENPSEQIKKDPSRGLTLVVLSVATSIDALAVGFSLAMMNVGIWYPSIMIGVITSAMSLAGIRLGRVFGRRFGPRMEMTGGIILVAIGTRILIADLFF